MNGFRNASYVGFVLFVFGLVLFLYGFYNLSIEKSLDEKGIKTVGEVYDLAITEPYRQAWVVFLTEEGKEVRFLDKLYWNHSFEKYKIGDRVEVIYDPGKPQQTAVINHFFQRTTEPWWPVIVGVIVILVGYFLRRIMLKKAKELDLRLPH